MKKKLSTIENAIDGAKPVIVTFESKSCTVDISFVDATITFDGDFYCIDDGVSEISITFGADPEDVLEVMEDYETYELIYDDCNIFISFPCGSAA